MTMSHQDICALPERSRVFGLGEARQDRHPARTLDHWVLGTVEEGRLSLAIGAGPGALLDPGWFYLLPPGVSHHGPQRSAFTVTWWHFRAPVGEPPCFLLPCFGRIPPEVDTWRSLRAGELQRHRGDDPRWLDALLADLLARLASANRHGPGTSAGALADAILAWLLDHRDRPWDRVALERHFGYSYRHLNRCFHGAYGSAIRTRHLALRLDRAADRIAAGDSLATAARATGFADYPNFLRRFRRVRGVTAGSLRPS